MASTARLILSHAVVLLLLLLCAAKPATSRGWVPANPNSYTVRDLVQRALEIYDVSPSNRHRLAPFLDRGFRAYRLQLGRKILWYVVFTAKIYDFVQGSWQTVLVDALITKLNSGDMSPQILFLDIKT